LKDLKPLIFIKDKLNRKRIINYICYFALGITIFSGFFDFFLGQFEANGTRLIICLIYGGIYFLNKTKTDLAGILVNVISSIVLGIYCCLVGREPLVHLYLFSVLVGTPFAINTRNRKVFFSILSIPIIVYLMLEASNFNFFNIHLNTANPEVISIFNILFNFILIQFYVFLIIRIFQKNEDRLIKNENQLKKQNLDLVKVNKALDLFVFSVSHNLRAPISSVLGLVELSKTEENLETLNHYNKLKAESLQKLDVYINDVLDYSRNQRMRLSNDEVDFEQLIDTILENQKFTKNAQLILFSKKINQEGLFITDEKRLKSILANIVSNSIKYADLEKTNPKINIEIYSDRNKAEIIISDNGIGIEKEMQSKIFNMFYRANATEPGTGLGLYIAKETIEVLNGTIKIDSALGEGTTCIINLVSLDKA